jgi:hypothetical protein
LWAAGPSKNPSMHCLGAVGVNSLHLCTWEVQAQAGTLLCRWRPLCTRPPSHEVSSPMAALRRRSASWCACFHVRVSLCTSVLLCGHLHVHTCARVSVHVCECVSTCDESHSRCPGSSPTLPMPERPANSHPCPGLSFFLTMWVRTSLWPLQMARFLCPSCIIWS